MDHLPTSSSQINLDLFQNRWLLFIFLRFGNFPSPFLFFFPFQGHGLYNCYTVIKQVLEGLVYLHEQGVIHRDIKGANILTTKEASLNFTLQSFILKVILSSFYAFFLV